MPLEAHYYEFPEYAPSEVLLPLEVVGFVPWRPLGKSHFKPAPWAMIDHDFGDGDVLADYAPSVMSVNAMKKSMMKAVEPVHCYSEAQLQRMFDYGVGQLNSIWFGPNDLTYAEVIDSLNMEKSPGFPYYYRCVDKADALEKYGDTVQRNVYDILAGVDIVMPFAGTLKDELRSKERVAAEKTRAFCASGLEHLICSQMMFKKQNDKLVEKICQGFHPITLGITVPGTQFVRAILSLGDRSFDADGDGCDQRFNLGIARIIRELRKLYSRKEFWQGINNLYDAVYCGFVVVCGVIYRLFHNKSGWANTGMDNSLYMWLVIYEAVTALTNKPFEQVCKLLVNGDDLAFSFDDEVLDVVMLANYLGKYNVRISYDQSLPRLAREITFLSHRLQLRNNPLVGDFYVAAGNRNKLLSSLNWIKTNPNLAFEESCLAHLLGLRICLYPWAEDFEAVEVRIDEYLSKITFTSRVRELLRARIPEIEIVGIHLRLEGFGFFSPIDALKSIRF